MPSSHSRRDARADASTSLCSLRYHQPPRPLVVWNIVAALQANNPSFDLLWQYSAWQDGPALTTSHVLEAVGDAPCWFQGGRGSGHPTMLSFWMLCVQLKAAGRRNSLAFNDIVQLMYGLRPTELEYQAVSSDAEHSPANVALCREAHAIISPSPPAAAPSLDEASKTAAPPSPNINAVLESYEPSTSIPEEQRAAAADEEEELERLWETVEKDLNWEETMDEKGIKDWAVFFDGVATVIEQHFKLEKPFSRNEQGMP